MKQKKFPILSLKWVVMLTTNVALTKWGGDHEKSRTHYECFTFKGETKYFLTSLDELLNLNNSAATENCEFILINQDVFKV